MYEKEAKKASINKFIIPLKKKIFTYTLRWTWFIHNVPLKQTVHMYMQTYAIKQYTPHTYQC